MFRQSGNSAPPASASAQVLTTGTGGGTGSDVNLIEVGGDPISLGQAAMADSLPVVIASDQSPLPVSITSADVNLIEVGGAAIALGQTTMAASVPVVLASNQSDVPTTVSGNVTVVQPTGTNLHAVLDTGSTTAVTQATATNLKAQAEAYQGGTAVGAANPLQVSLANTGANATAVKVDGTGGSFPISGTVTSNQGTSPWIVAGGGTAGASATGVVTVQGIASGTALPISAAALPLPSGASTLAEQQAQTAILDDVWNTGTSSLQVRGIGTAGTADAGVLTIQGIAAMTPLLVTPGANSAVNVAQFGGTNVSTGTGAGGAGIPRVTISNDSSLAANQSVNVAQMNGVTVTMNSGNTGTGVQRVVLATDQPKFSVTSNYPERAFFGTAQTVINTATDIAAAAFSGAPAATFDNTTDAAVPYARYARAMLEAPDWAAAPVAGTTVDLYGILLNVDGTDDETDAPSGSAVGGAHYFGSWVMAAADALQRRAIVIDLLGVEQVDFYIRNGTAQNMNNDGGTNCVVKVTPLAYGVVA